MSRTTPRGFSLVGMLVTLVCVVVLFAIGMSAMNRAVTGEGSAADGTVHSMQDKLYLYALHQSMAVVASEFTGERFITPGALTDDAADDVTASLYSAMLMQNYTSPEQLISANEFSGYVDPIEGYEYRIYSPGAGVYWDPAFKADLQELSNVSFAHMPLFGDRVRAWRAMYDARTPLLGNRGPKDGVPDPTSYTYGRNGVWGGHVVFGDGHIEFIDTFTPSQVFFERDGERYADNIFAVEDGLDGRDAILSFTKSMTRQGPESQFD